MRGIFDIDSKFMTVVIKIFDGMCLSILWFLLCLPVVTMGASTTALYATSYHYLRKDEGTLLRTFWKAFRENWKRSTVLGLVFLAVAALLGVDVLVFRTKAIQGDLLGKAYWLVLLLCGMAITWSVYLFAYAARLNGSVAEVLKLSFVLMLIHPIKAIGVFAVAFAGILACVTAPVVLTIVPVAVYVICSFTIEKIFAAHLPPETEDAQAQKDEEIRK